MHIAFENQKFFKFDCDKSDSYTYIFSTYLKHKSIVAYIEGFILESGIRKLYNESIINDAFNVLAMKEELSVYGKLSTDNWIEQGASLRNKLEIDMMQHYERLILVLKGKKIDEITQDIIKIIENGDHYFISPNCWTIKPEFYEKLKLDPIEQIALCVSNQNFVVRKY